MDLWSALAVLRRRWIVFTGGLLVIAGALAGMLRVVPASFEAQGEYLLIVPAQKGAEAGQIGLQNPYLGFGGSLNIMTFILARSLASQTAAREVLDSGGTGEYIVDLVPGDAPIIAITATSSTAATAMKTYSIVEERLIRELNERQATAGAPQNLRIVSIPVRTPIEPKVKNGSRIRAAAGIVVLGGALTLMLTFLTESLANRRRMRREAREALDRHPGGGPPEREDDSRSPPPAGTHEPETDWAGRGRGQVSAPLSQRR